MGFLPQLLWWAEIFVECNLLKPRQNLLELIIFWQNEKNIQNLLIRKFQVLFMFINFVTFERVFWVLIGIILDIVIDQCNARICLWYIIGGWEVASFTGMWYYLFLHIGTSVYKENCIIMSKTLANLIYCRFCLDFMRILYIERIIRPEKGGFCGVF